MLALLLAQVAVLTHDAAAAQHADDTLCQLCLAGHSVGSAVISPALAVLPPAPVVPPPASPARGLFKRAAAPWQARAPPFLL